MRRLIQILLLSLLPLFSFSQNSNIGAKNLKVTKKSRFIQDVTIGSSSFDASAILGITSITKGLLIPSMTTTQRDNISSPTEGLKIYNLTTKQHEFFETTWQVIGGDAVISDSSFVTLQTDSFKAFNNTNIQVTDSTIFQEHLQTDKSFTVNLGLTTLKGVDATNSNFGLIVTDNVDTKLLTVRLDGAFSAGSDVVFNGTGLPLSIGADTVGGRSGIAIGSGAKVTAGNEPIAIGVTSIASATNAIAVGTDAQATGLDNIGLGHLANATNQFTVAIGSGASATASKSIAIGNSASAINTDNIAIGSAASASQSNTIAIGSSATASSANSVSIGTASTAGNLSSVAIGINASALGRNATAIGPNSSVSSVNEAIAIGISVSATALNSMAIGFAASATGTESVAIGHNMKASASGAVALGSHATIVDNTVANSLAITLQSATPSFLFAKTADSFLNGSGNVGIGLDAVISSKLHIKGINISTDTFALKVQDSAGVELFTVVNDGDVIASKTFNYFTDTSSVDDSYGINETLIASYTIGMNLYVSIGVANTGAATLQINALAAKTIKKLHDQDLVTGDIELGQIIHVIYDGTFFQLLSTVAQ